jgi:hypothetical protein
MPVITMTGSREGFEERMGWPRKKEFYSSRVEVIPGTPTEIVVKPFLVRGLQNAFEQLINPYTQTPPELSITKVKETRGTWQLNKRPGLFVHEEDKNDLLVNNEPYPGDTLQITGEIVFKAQET